MKHILSIGAVLFLMGCSDPKVDQDLIDLQNTLKQNQKQLDVINCDIGILIMETEFFSLLKGKVTKEQLDRVWAKCEELQ